MERQALGLDKETNNGGKVAEIASSQARPRDKQARHQGNRADDRIRWPH